MLHCFNKIQIYTHDDNGDNDDNGDINNANGTMMTVVKMVTMMTKITMMTMKRFTRFDFLEMLVGRPVLVLSAAGLLLVVVPRILSPEQIFPSSGSFGALTFGSNVFFTWLFFCEISGFDEKFPLASITTNSRTRPVSDVMEGGAVSTAALHRHTPGHPGN